MYHLIGHSDLDITEREKIISRIGSDFSIVEFRNYTQPAMKENNSGLVNVSSKDYISIVRFINNRNYDGLISFLNEGNIIQEYTAVVGSIVSVGVVNIINDSDVIDFIKNMNRAGLHPSLQDIRYAVLSGKSEEIIYELAKSAKFDLNETWIMDGSRFNLTTFSASLGRFDYSMLFYSQFAIPLYFDLQPAAIDFVDLNEYKNNADESFIVEQSIKENIYPLERHQRESLKNKINSGLLFASESYIKGLIDIIDEKQDFLELSYHLSPERFKKFEEYYNRYKKAKSNLDVIDDEVKLCARAEIAVNDNSSNYIHRSALEYDISNISSIRKSFKDIIEATDLDLIKLEVLKEAAGVLDAEGYEESLKLIDEFVTEKNIKDAPALYSKFAAIVVVKGGTYEAFKAITEKGGSLPKLAIFSFIKNGDLRSIDLYRKFYDINSITDTHGNTPMQRALLLNSSSDVIERIK